MYLQEKILEDIEKTDFVTELKTVSILIKNKWSATHGATYEDKDENRNREIDIVASKANYVSELGFRLAFYLVIEVKKSTQPWIVFTTTSSSGGLGWRIMHRCYNCYKWQASGNFVEGGYRKSILDVDCIRKNSIRENTLRVGKAFHELEKTPTDKSKIYEALICSGKAAHYLKNISEEEPLKDFDIHKEVDIEIYLPIVVLDGLLFEVFTNHSGGIAVQEKDFIPVEMSYSSPKYRKDNWDTDFFPDIVRFDYLSKHLENIEKWRLSMIDKVSTILKSLGKQPYIHNRI
ncbi:MAG: hypothetical protein JST57_03140 [Bacteroidetes bacterium]|nr:hypothetical protein [Bacteroidota bacterium]